MLQMWMSVPLVPRVIVASVQIQLAISLVIALEPGTKETHVKPVNTVERRDFTFTLHTYRFWCNSYLTLFMSYFVFYC